MADGSKMNLIQMQNYFEDRINSIRTLSDLELSLNDYKSLGTKLKSLTFFTGSENNISEIMLSVVVYSTYSLIYWDGKTGIDDIFNIVLSDSQYLERLHLKLFEDAFYEYGLNNYGYDYGDLKDRCIRLIARHAGVPDDEKEEYFDLISRYLECRDVAEMEDEIFDALPYKTKFIFSQLDKASRLCMFMDSRNLIYDVLHGEMSRTDLLKAFPDTSISLIDHCIYWAEKQKINMTS